MNCRPFEESDLGEVCQWFADIVWPLPAIEGVLPKIGIIVEDESKTKLACGWLYTTDTNLAFLSWTATNPNVDEAVASRAMDTLIEGVQEAVKKHAKQIKIVMALSRNTFFTQKLKNLNFRAKPGFELATWIVKE